MVISSGDARVHYRAISPGVHEAGGDPNDDRSTRAWTSSERLIKWSFFVLGCAVLLPWLAMTNETSFFLSRLTDSPFYSTFSSSVSSTYGVVKLFCMIYCTTTFKQSSPSRRIFISLIATILFIASLFFSTFVRGTPLSFFAFALFDTASLAALSSYLVSAVYGQAALFGPSFLQHVFSGQGAITVVISIVQVVGAVISLWGFSLEPTNYMIMGTDDEDYQAESIAARIVFGVVISLVCVALAAYTWLTRQASYKLLIGAGKQQRDSEIVDELTGLVSNDVRRIPTEDNSLVYQVLVKNWVLFFSISYVYAVTLAVFPTITVRIHAVNAAIPPLLFTAIHFLVFSIGDVAGRNVFLFPRFVVWTPRKILAMSLLRTAFIPLLLLCNVERPATSPPFTPFINSDTLFMIILFTMGYTNGYVMCVGLVVVSSTEHNPRLEGRRENVDTAATLAGTFMIVGLTSGALSSFSVQAMIGS